MSTAIPRDVLTRVKKLAQLPEEARQSHWGVPVTRLTILKSLCQDHEVADRFVTCLARDTRQRVKEKEERPGYLSMEEWSRHAGMIDRAVTALESYLKQPSEEERSRLSTLFHGLVGEQNEHRTIHGGPVRIIKNNDLLLVEYALRTALADEASLPFWAYQTARHYAERYDARHGEGLTPASAPLLQDIADFWLQECNLDLDALKATAGKEKAKNGPGSKRGTSKGRAAGTKKPQFTPRQGQFLAFIHLYRKLHRQGPDEQDMALYFGVKPASVRATMMKLKELGLVTEKPGVPRSLRVAVPKSKIPALEDAQGPPW
jgi:hypothetical protein